MRGYSAFPKAPALLEPHHPIVSCHIQETHWGSLTPLKRCSWCILLLQPGGPTTVVVVIVVVVVATAAEAVGVVIVVVVVVIV